MWKRREVLKLGMLASTAAVAPRWALAAGATEADRQNLALNRAAWTSSSADFISTGHMATDGQAVTEWLSENADAQWIYVDLGAAAKVRSVVLRWGANHAQAYKVQVSTESGPSADTGLVENWREVQQTSSGKGGVEEITLPEIEARYVRILMTAKARPEGYSLKAFEVYGEGGYEDPPSVAPPPDADGTLHLSGGWRLINEAAIADKAAVISRRGYDDSKWLAATVPGTVLTSYHDIGAVPDPFYSDDLRQISDFFAHTNWWYRTEVELPQNYAGRRVWLSFDGINYRAYVYVNGVSAGSINGAFVRGRFDVTKLMKTGRNCIAVLIMPVPKPDKVMPKPLSGYKWPVEYPKNEPTILAGASWDWLPTIRDRNTGIWNHVRLTASGDVTIENPFASTHFPDSKDLSRADITLKLELKNHSAEARRGELKVRLGEVEFTQPVALEGGETKALTLDKSSQPKLSLDHPRLWWPSGYGEQNLYGLTLEFACDGKVSDVNRSRIGVREFTYNQPSLTRWDTGSLSNHVADVDQQLNSSGGTRKDDPLMLLCNGQRIFIRGVNWGMDEGMLRCDRQGYESRLRMEKEMNFNLIRNWSGNLDKTEFYEICDEYGLMVWEEFGIANSLMPDDPIMWLANARDRFLR
ncbi:MAG: discoidin domain-containing protein, partial [Acidobacteriaceae bacterium]|nr:discoidin domain-containing protein [Acidobacteriaceae bacterium]